MNNLVGQSISRTWQQMIPVQITGAPDMIEGMYYYPYIEQQWQPQPTSLSYTSYPTYVANPSARAGTGIQGITEMNNTLLTTFPFYAWARMVSDAPTGIHYEFLAPVQASPTPFVPCFALTGGVFNTADSDIFGNPITFADGTVVHDTSSFYSSGSPTVVTVPVTGLYQFNGAALLTVNEDTVSSFGIWIGGTADGYGGPGGDWFFAPIYTPLTLPTVSPGYMSASLSAYLMAGSQVSLMVGCGRSGDSATGNLTASYAVFSGFCASQS